MLTAMPFATVDDVRLFYTDEGQGGVPLVLLHGWTCDSHDWSWQLDAFAARHRVLAVDLRAHGRSCDPGSGHHHPRQFARDVLALLDALGCGPAVLVGHSMGAMVASVCAVEAPERVLAVVSVEGSYGLLGPGADVVRQVIALMADPTVSAPELAASALGAIEGEQIPAALTTWHRRRTLGTDPAVVRDVLGAMYDGADQFGLAEASADYLAGRTCPVLSFHAEPAKAAWEQALKQHPDSESVLWEGAGHWPHQSRPAEFNEHVLRWTARVTS